MSTISEADLKQLCTTFFYWWYNRPGSNTLQGFDEWFAKEGEQMLEALSTATYPFPQPIRKDGGEPCGECHIQPGETCDICGAKNALAAKEQQP